MPSLRGNNEIIIEHKFHNTSNLKLKSVFI